MAAFSYQYQHQQPFIVDSIMASQLHEEHNINTTFPPYYFHIHQEPSFSVTDNQETSCDQSSKISISDTELSIVKNQSPENSMVVDKLENGEQVTQKVTPPMEKKRRTRKSSFLSSPLSKDTKEGGSKKQKKNSGEVKGQEKKEQKKNDEELPKGYIHVRARRGQATDSHSLAERVRREKISERMKILQKLVPGCDQVTGKALVLDEIINYVQSLQNQVEFLSMKLASMNPAIFFDNMAMDIDTLFVRPDQKLLNSIASTSELPSVPLCSSNNATTTFADTTTVMTTTNNYDYLLDYPSPVFLQGHKSNTFLEHTGGGPFWDAEDQRQKFLNPYGFGNNTCSLN